MNYKLAIGVFLVILFSQTVVYPINKTIKSDIKNGNLKKVQEYLKKYKTWVNILHWTKEEKELLFHATYYNQLEIVDFLLSEGVDVDYRNRNKETPLCRAVEKNFIEMAQLLIRSGADVDYRNRNKETPLYRAVEKNFIEMAQLLIRSGADVNAGGGYGGMTGVYFKITPLHIAAEKGYYPIVELLLNNKANVNVYNYKNLTPLHKAVEKGNYSIVELLLNNKADVDVYDSENYTPLHIAAGRSNSVKSSDRNEIIKLLLSHNAKVNTKSEEKYQYTPLHSAADKGRVHTVKLLVEHGADLYAKTKDGLIPPMCVLKESRSEIKNRLAILKYFVLECGVDGDLKNKNTGITSLYLVITAKDYDFAKYLIEKGAKVNMVDKSGDTLLHVAIYENRQIKMVNLLLENGVDINAKTKKGNTPLHFTVMLPYQVSEITLKLVELLVNNGADLNIKNIKGKTPYECAEYGLYTREVRALIDEWKEKKK